MNETEGGEAKRTNDEKAITIVDERSDPTKPLTDPVES